MSHDDLVLGRLDPDAVTGFRRDSMLRQIGAEPVTGLLLQRALVMEVTHPKVGAAVEAHSTFRRQPVRRLWATFDAAMRLVFGRPDEARAAARQIYRFHDHVNGPLPDASAEWPAGTRYTAHDATLLLWVWATLVDTAEVAYERWVRPLTHDEAAGYYADHCTFARFFGIPGELIPPDRGAFASYLDKMLDSDQLASTPTSTAVVRDVLWFKHWMVPQVVVRPLRILAIGTLDERLRDRLDLSLDRHDQRLFDKIDDRLRRNYTRLPEARTMGPYVYLAVRRPFSPWLPGNL